MRSNQAAEVEAGRITPPRRFCQDAHRTWRSFAGLGRLPLDSAAPKNNGSIEKTGNLRFFDGPADSALPGRDPMRFANAFLRCASYDSDCNPAARAIRSSPIVRVFAIASCKGILVIS